ncbi:MAG: hypothetical protein QGF53_11900 [Alphaproteobacteria bacterium]|nr:hypothetical protein [Alphaproteobacteria bacterium]
MRSLAAAVFAALIAAAPALAGDREREWQFVHDVLFGGYAEGDPADRRVNRFVEQPLAMVFDGQPADIEFVAGAIAAIDVLLGETRLRLETRWPDFVNVALLVLPRERLPWLVRQHDLNGNVAKLGVGYTETWLGPELDIDRSLAIIMAETQGRERRATLIHELYHTLGPGGHSALFPESVVYEDGLASSSALVLAPVDVKLLALLYRHLKPGDTVAEARAAFDLFWDSLDPLVDQYNASRRSP